MGVSTLYLQFVEAESRRLPGKSRRANGNQVRERDKKQKARGVARRHLMHAISEKGRAGSRLVGVDEVGGTITDGDEVTGRRRPEQAEQRTNAPRREHGHPLWTGYRLDLHDQRRPRPGIEFRHGPALVIEPDHGTAPVARAWELWTDLDGVVGDEAEAVEPTHPDILLRPDHRLAC